MKTKTLIGALAAGGLLSLNTLSATAAGLGRINVLSALGQPLQAEIELVAVQKGEIESLSARVPSPDAFRDAKIEYSHLFSNVRISVEKRVNGQPYLRVVTTQSVEEPFLDMLVELTSASGRLLREFPILLDPPGVETKLAAAPVPAKEPAQAAAAPAAVMPPAAREPAVVPAPAKSVAAPSSLSQGARVSTAPGQKTPGNYTVQAGDTLSAIASSNRPAGVNLDQMLVSLYRENQAAFIDNNMNRIRVGQILHVPSADEAKAIPASEAKDEVRAQSTDFAAYRQKLAGKVAAAPSRADTAGQTASGKIGGAVVEQAAPKAEGPKDVLKLSKGGVVTGKADVKGAAISQERASALQEEAIAKDNQLRDQKTRVAELEKNIQEMQRLLELKNQNFAELQKQVGAKPTAPAAQAPVIAPAATPPKPAPVEPAKAPSASDAASSTAPVAETKPTPEIAPATEAKTAEVAKPTPVAPVKTPAVAPAPQPEPSFVDELTSNPLYLAAGAGLVILIGIFGLSAMRRRQASAAAGSHLGGTSTLATDLRSGSFSGVKSGAVVDTGNSSFLTDFEKTGPGVIDTEEVDPVAEAEVYIAYGRDAQAEEILKEALAKDPSRHEIPMKLLEIYAARKSASSFETVARELHQRVGADHPVWSRVQEMGRQFDPTNALYAAPARAGSPAAMPASAVHERSPELTLPPLAPIIHDLDFDLKLPAKPSVAKVELPVSEARAEAPPPLDFVIDSPAPSAGKPGAQPASGLDFDLSGLDLPAKSTASAASIAASKGGLDGQYNDDALDLTEFSLEKPAVPAPPALTPRLVSASPSITLASSTPAPMDLSSLSLDLGTTAPGAVGDAVPEQEGDTAWHSVATKLDLARAYLEIGDKEGAREILQEVMNEGDADQRREAETLSAALA
jgi:pilus assembly protein FimV